MMKTLCLIAAFAIALPALAGGDVIYIEDEGSKGAFLGVSLKEDTKESEGGARVTEVIEGSPADRAGLEEDDVIQRFGGKRVRGPAGLTEQLQEKKPGDRVSLSVMRDGKQQEIDVELGERSGVWSYGGGRVFGIPLDDEDLESLEELGEWGQRFSEEWGEGKGFGHIAPRAFAFSFGRPKLGVELAETTPELRRHFGGSDEAGVLVSKVLPDMPAEEAGLEVGDLIVAVDGEAMVSADDLREALSERDGEVLKIEVVRDKRRQTLEVTLPEPDKRERPNGPRAHGVAPDGTAPYVRAVPRAVRVLRVPAAPPTPPPPPAPPAAPAPLRHGVQNWV